MSEEFVAQAGVEFLSRHFDTLFGRVKTLYRNVSDEVRIRWRSSYESYLHSSYIGLTFFDDPVGIGFLINNVRLSDVYSLVIEHYLSPVNISNNFFDINSEFSKRVAAISESEDGGWTGVRMSKIVQDKQAFELIANGNNWYSKSSLADALKVKDLLIEKHKQQEAFLDEELLT